MNETNTQPDFFTELGRELRQGWQALKDGWHHGGVSLRNGLRQLRAAKVDYIVMTLGGPMPERAEQGRSFLERQLLRLPPPPFSMEQLNNRLRLVADADNVKGVVFILKGLDAGLASLQNIRQAILRLRAAGKKVVVFTPSLDTAHYFVATAADHIIVPPGAVFNVIGMRSQAIFLKDALARVGIQVDVVQISPYKSAFNMVGESNITPEQEEQMTWLLAEVYEMVTAAMADGRGLARETFQEIIDTAPHFARAALAAGLVDGIGYEDELPTLLAQTAAEAETEAAKTDETDTAVTDSAATPEPDNNPKARLRTWADGGGLLLEKPHRHTAKFIGVISLQGLITMGASQRPPLDIPIPLVGGITAGETTLLSLLRRAEKMERMAALIFHVDSSGGDALASDLIAREIQRLNQKKPVLVYMGNVAASGGYYVSAPGGHIMSQPLTITGSIGVIMGRFSTGDLLRKLHINRASVQRGRRAGLYTNPEPMTAEERQVFREGIEETYRQFKEVVAQNRPLSLEELDPICEGRVWSGRQALDHCLVDSHGDFPEAIQKAAELAGMPVDETVTVPVVNLYPESNRHILPRSYEAAADLAGWLAGERIQMWAGRPLLLLPYEIRFK